MWGTVAASEQEKTESNLSLDLLVSTFGVNECDLSLAWLFCYSPFYFFSSIWTDWAHCASITPLYLKTQGAWQTFRQKVGAVS